MPDPPPMLTTLMREQPWSAKSSGGWARSSQASLPADLLAESVTRLRVIAAIYAVTYFASAYGPPLLVSELRQQMFGDLHSWLPGAVSIVGALVLIWITYLPRLSDRTKMRIGLLFEIVGSFGIAAGEYHGIVGPILIRDAPFDGFSGFGLSWVAPWVLLFTTAVPNPPRIATAGAALSVSAVPLVFGLWLALGVNEVPMAAGPYFFSLVFPYILIVLLAYVGARVVYGLGRAVREARQLGSYRLVERMGVGGMGEVWRARHRMLARPAAIKLVRPEVLGAKQGHEREVMLQRFEREAQATALMRSPHTMELYDYGVAEDGTLYYVMELLNGLDLDRLVETFGPVPAERAVYLLMQLCDSLAEAHDAGLTHRDIKPANLYVCHQGKEADFVKVLDFGLVKLDPGVPAETKLTAEHSASGTPAFMSPEQVIGEDLDGRSDLYSAGCVAYWMLTGTLVFRGRTPMETMMMHAQAAPDQPSGRTDLMIPEELAELVMDCLAKNREDRPASAEELRARLDAIPVEQPWTRRRAQEWWEMHRPIPTEDGAT